jgi:hypothetical protein
MLTAGLRIMPEVRSRRRSSQPGGGFLLAREANNRNGR